MAPTSCAPAADADILYGNDGTPMSSIAEQAAATADRVVLLDGSTRTCWGNGTAGEAGRRHGAAVVLGCCEGQPTYGALPLSASRRC